MKSMDPSGPNNAPLLNEYKRPFLWRRLILTFTGGVKFRAGLPAYVNVLLVLLFLLPLLLASLAAVLADIVISKPPCGEVNVIIICIHIFMALSSFIIIAACQGRLFYQKQELAMYSDAELDDDDDEMQEFESCLHITTLGYILQQKSRAVNAFLIHPLIGALMVTLAFDVTRLYIIKGDLVVGSLVFVFGWLSVSIAHYPLLTSHVPETAVWGPADIPFDLASLHRAFYVIITCLVPAVYRLTTLSVCPQNYSSYVLTVPPIILCSLPLLWTVGILPPLTALVLWFGEQANIIIFGGSAMASGERLAVVLTASGLLYLIAMAIPSPAAAASFICVTGYCLSTDFMSIIYNCRTRPPDEERGYRSKLQIILQHIVMIMLCAGLPALHVRYLRFEFTSSPYLLLGASVLWCLCSLFSQLQKVYMFGGLVRNVFYPKSIQRASVYNSGRKCLNVFGWIYWILYRWVAPIGMLILLLIATNWTYNYKGQVFVKENGMNTSSITEYRAGKAEVALGVLSTMRAFRWIWQSPGDALLELCALGIYSAAVQRSTYVDFTLIFFYTSITNIKLQELINKLSSYAVLLYQFYADKKQTRGLGVKILIVAFIPFSLLSIAISTCLSAPVLPLFTLPLLFIAFPRPVRFWSAGVGDACNHTKDTQYYEQAIPQLKMSVTQAFANGVYGDVKPGDQLLLRYQDRLLWLLVLEKGYDYCKISMKGLELQETSCHTVEALFIDDLCEAAFEGEGSIACKCNPYPACTATPCDGFRVMTYSDAKNQLTGIIDSPENLATISKNFSQAFIWILVKKIIGMKNPSKSHSKAVNSMAEVNEESSAKMSKSHLINVTSADVAFQQSSDTEQYEAADKRPVTALSQSSIGSWGDTSSVMELMEQNHSSLENTKRLQANPTPKTQTTGLGSDNYLLDDEMFLPAADINGGKTDKKISSAAVSNLADTCQFSSSLSPQLCVPLKWREIPVNYSDISAHVTAFPLSWFKHVLSCSELDIQKYDKETAVSELIADDKLVSAYTKLLAAGLAVIKANGMGLTQLYKIYCGKLPWSPLSDWLDDNTDIKHVLLQSYRYAVKLMIDQALMGEAASLDEVQEYLEEYDKNSYIGNESDDEWRNHLMASTSSLFSLDYDVTERTYNSRVLTLCDVPVYGLKLNAETVHSVWSNLTWELLYVTNDDEERYSIQAHRTVLRNLITQSADAPLGYPVHSTRPLTLHI